MSFLIFGLFLILSVGNSESASNLYCYSCSATLGQHVQCANMSMSGNETPYTYCFYEDAVCAKYVIDYGNNLMVHRSCHHRDVCAVLAQRYQGPYSRLIDCQTCDDHNYCNSAEDLQKSALIAIISTVLVSLFI